MIDELDILQDEEDRKAMCDTILARSSGMLLWVRLVLREFEAHAIWTTEDMHSILREIPADISQLYTKSLTPLLENKRTLKLIKPILSWITLGSRTFTTQEIRCAIELEIHETLQNIEKAIPSICAQLLSVNRGNRVHAIHETFREFLLSKRCPPVLGMGKARSHSRIAMILL